MDTNYNWKVYVPNKKNTFPYMEKRLCIVYANSEISVFKKEFLNFAFFENGKFKGINGETYPDNQVLFWRYVERFPDAVHTISVEKCTKKNNPCEFEDNGYCMRCEYKKNCPYCKVVEEYYAVNN